MSTEKRRGARTRYAILGVLSSGAATGYEVRKRLQQTTAHFWKESYGQIYPTIEELLAENLIAVDSHENKGRERKRHRILPAGGQELQAWIRSPEIELRPGRNELLLKLFFAGGDDAEALLIQVDQYASHMASMADTYSSFQDDPATDELAADRRILIGTTVDFGVAAAQMQLEWCRRTRAALTILASGSR